MDTIKQFKSNEDILVKNCDNLNHNFEKLKKALEDKCKENNTLIEKLNEMALSEKPKSSSQPRILTKSI
jgi:prefoldin subunit 5